MSIEDRKKREQNQRRNQILNAAEAVIEKKGFNNATMDEIAEEAELSKGTLYLYFSHKTGLYLAINKRGLKKLNDSFQEIMKKDLEGLAMVKELGESFLSFIAANPEYTKALIYYESLVDDKDLQGNKYTRECEELGRQLLMYLTRAIQVGMQDGSIAHRMEAKLLAIQIWASLRGMMQLYQVRSQHHLQKMMQDFEMNMETMIKQFLDVQIKGIQTSN